jgi:predicted transcriptional regulator
MSSINISNKQDLIKLIQTMDDALLQRVADFTKGLLQGSQANNQDFWDELPQSVKDGYEEGMKDIEQGNLIPMEEVMKKYRQ